MTRINTIDVKLLADQHLMAEYRELPMVSSALRRSIAGKSGGNGLLSRIPKQYTLNKGHVLFFYNKGKFLSNRYNQLIEELYDRGYSITPSDRDVSFDVHFDRPSFGNDWSACDADHVINCDRILQRISEKPNWYKMKGRVISQGDYVDMIKARYYK